MSIEVGDKVYLKTTELGAALGIGSYKKQGGKAKIVGIIEGGKEALYQVELLKNGRLRTVRRQDITVHRKPKSERRGKQRGKKRGTKQGRMASVEERRGRSADTGGDGSDGDGSVRGGRRRKRAGSGKKPDREPGRPAAPAAKIKGKPRRGKPRIVRPKVARDR